MKKLAIELLNHERIVIVSHVSPDGDTLGSALAICRALNGLGKRAVVMCQDEPPMMYSFMPDIGMVIKPEKYRAEFDADCVIYVDVAIINRAGSAFDATENIGCKLLLDHHATNVGFDGTAVIDKDAASTGELALELLDELGVALDGVLAVMIYTAISTDTGNFSYESTTPESFRAAARCLEAGLNLDEINRKLFRTRSVPRTKMIGFGLSKMIITDGGRLAYIPIDRGILESAGARHEDLEGLVNYLAEMEGVDACFTAEANDKGVKCSLRSGKKVDVSAIAQALGGGGHMHAAGLTLNMPLEAACLKLLSELRRALGEA